ncbi:hypothetical protein [Paraliomyxa miuraensis]|uniref:hypothetical protein n=1 Tax=Paraliomyxa miuraensis TaxID=376150 RepID=UPI00224DE011|nr:hypothetical protein [Paraliomyxa miuraensis]MCX4244137.1 hypothetical protein [Paraliomyxa miuraensis]
MTSSDSSGGPSEAGAEAEVATTGAEAPAPAGGPEGASSKSAEASAPDGDASWLDGTVFGIDVITLIVALVVLVVLVVTVVLIVRWQRKRREDEPRTSGPSVGARLRSVWVPFYAKIPRRAEHYPTFVVMGEAGVGKSHLIRSRVDWRGQVNQYNPAAYQNPLVQLYLGSEVVVHELSAPLLRDVSSTTKRALRQLWRNAGPSMTVVLVLDARTLATTPPEDLRTLAQLVRGKIGLFPRRVAKAVDVRVCLTHLDSFSGYEEFAAVVGTHEKGIELELLGSEYVDAQALVAAYDAHLAHALTSRTGDEFARLVGFYDILGGLVRTLPPLLTSLRGEAWHDTRIPPSELYLGSIVPHSHVGDPFEADAGLVVASIARYNRRTLLGATALGAATMSVVAGVSLWHLQRVGEAEAAVDAHDRKQDDSRRANPEERLAAEDATRAIARMVESEVLWLRWAQIDRKRTIADHFEHTVRTEYLLPWLEDESWGEDGADRVTLLYVASLIHGTRGGQLGLHIQDNARWWAKELGLSESMVTYYVQSSDELDPAGVELPEHIDRRTGREWIEHQERLCAAFGRTEGTLSVEAIDALREQPELRSQAEYEALERTRLLLEADPLLALPLEPILGTLDAEVVAEAYEDLVEVSEAVDELTEPMPPMPQGGGLGQLLARLDAIERWRAAHQEVSSVVDRTCEQERGTAVALMARSRAHDVIEQVLEGIPRERLNDGRAFFDESERLLDEGAVRGYGGGATTTIPGHYTKSAFEDHVEPVLAHASDTLPTLELEAADRARVQRAIKDTVTAYARAYRDALVTYYLGFEFNPGSRVALPFALKALTQPSSWFTDFLTTVTHNAALTLPDDQYHEPLKRALEVFGPLTALLAEKDGAIPGLEPYTAIIAELLPLMEGSGAPPAEGDRLEERLSGLGKLVLHTAQGKEVDRRAVVTEWLEGAQLDYGWHDPFDAPIEQVYRYGARDVEDEIEEAWVDEVRPVVQPLLATYPFDGAAMQDARVSDIEALVREQGKEPGEFWAVLDRLVGPAMQRKKEHRVMLDGIPAPMGMLEMVRDLEDLSAALWDGDGKPVPLLVRIEPAALPTKEYEGRVASMAYLSAGGSAVYAFNQRPEAQTLPLRWWDQGEAILSLELTAPGTEDASQHTIEEVGSAFSFYRLLDEGRSCKGKECYKKRDPKEPLVTEAAIARGKSCGRWASRATTNLPVTFSVPVDALGRARRLVRFVVVSDPWAPFAVRDCR